jgi:hypothetical protein
VIDILETESQEPFALAGFELGLQARVIGVSHRNLAEIQDKFFCSLPMIDPRAPRLKIGSHSTVFHHCEKQDLDYLSCLPLLGGTQMFAARTEDPVSG